MRAAVGSLACGAVLALAAVSSGQTGSWAIDPVHVYYPRGDCRGSELDLEVWDRDQRRWRAHPGHARIPLESCQVEDAGILLQEIRSRCVEPEDSQPRPTWVVGLDVFDPQVLETCAPAQPAQMTGLLELHVTAPAPGERVAGPRMEVAIQGSVRMDGIDGSDYDLELVIDRSEGTRAGGVDVLAAQVEAARALILRLVPRLGAVRIGITAYPNMPPVPGTAETSARRVIGFSDDYAALDRALAGLLAQGASGFQTFGSALDFAAGELAGRPGAGARANARKVLVIAAHAAGGRPFGPTAAHDARFLAQLEDRLERHRARHVALHLFALGGIAEELAPELGALFERHRARFHRVLRPALATEFLSQVSLPRVTEVVVENRTAGGGRTPARLTPDGRFEATIATSTGRNRLWARATLSDGTRAERVWDFEFDDRVVKQLLLAAEREHMRRVQQKRLEVRPFLDGVVPPLPDVGAPPPE
jgi:hypothetical protein